MEKSSISAFTATKSVMIWRNTTRTSWRSIEERSLIQSSYSELIKSSASFTKNCVFNFQFDDFTGELWCAYKTLTCYSSITLYQFQSSNWFVSWKIKYQNCCRQATAWSQKVYQFFIECIGDSELWFSHHFLPSTSSWSARSQHSCIESERATSWWIGGIHLWRNQVFNALSSWCINCHGEIN